MTRRNSYKQITYVYPACNWLFINSAVFFDIYFLGEIHTQNTPKRDSGSKHRLDQNHALSSGFGCRLDGQRGTERFSRVDARMAGRPYSC